MPKQRNLDYIKENNKPAAIPIKTIIVQHMQEKGYAMNKNQKNLVDDICKLLTEEKLLK